MRTDGKKEILAYWVRHTEEKDTTSNGIGV